MHSLEFWDSCSLNKTSYISNHVLSEFLGLLCAEQSVGNLNKRTFRNSGTPTRRTDCRNSQTKALSEMLGLRLAEQHVGAITKHTFRSSGIPVRRTKHRKYQRIAFRNYGTPVRRTRRRKSRTMHSHNLWDSNSQNKTSEISTNALSEILGLQLAEQYIRHLKIYTFRNYGTPVRRTNNHKS